MPVNYEFPRQDIDESKKDFEWCKKHIDYAIDYYIKHYSFRKSKIQKNYNSYIGKVDEKRINYLLYTYKGKRNLGNFTDYTLGKNKIDLLIGEWIRTPLSHKVEVINRDARAKKLENIYVRSGMKASRNEITKLRDIVGVDIFDGMQIPEEDDDLNIITKNEKLMNLVIKNHIRKDRTKSKLADNWKDNLLNAECHSYLDLSEDGKVSLEKIDPRDAIYIEMQDDPYVQKSPLRGRREEMAVVDILSKYGHYMSKVERDKLYQMSSDPETYYYRQGYNGYRFYRMNRTNLVSDVFHIEWKSSREIHTKVIEDKNPNHEPFRKDLSPEFYTKNKKKIQQDVKNGKYKIETSWKEDRWEAVRIGEDLYIKQLCRKQPFQMQTRGEERKYRSLSRYTSLLFNTTDGIRVSLMEQMDNLAFLYNVVMYQMNRELAKLKGKVVIYDKAFLPKGMKIEDVMYRIMNDSVYVVNSSQDGNRTRRTIEVQGQIKEIDLGISQSFQQLIAIKIDIEQTIDRLSGINENRQGQIAASSTATNAAESIQASRTITTPMFFYFNKYVEEVLTKIAELTKIAWVYKNPEDSLPIIGDDGLEFFKVTKDFALDDYGLYVTDGQREQEIRQKVDVVAGLAVNSKELRLPDYLDYQMKETVGEALHSLRKGWKELREIQERDQQLQIDAEQRRLESQLQTATEDREDKQAHELEKITLQKGLESQQKTQDSKNQLVSDEAKADRVEK